MEIMIVLVISGLVISIASMLFMTIKEDVVNEQIEQDASQRVLRLHSLLESDILRSNRTEYKDGELILKHGKPEQRKHYIFKNAYVIRRTPHALDTFFVKVQQVQCDYIKDGTQLVSFLSINLVNSYQEQTQINISKRYPKSVLYQKNIK